jgi:hypothetical protein
MFTIFRRKITLPSSCWKIKPSKKLSDQAKEGNPGWDINPKRNSERKQWEDAFSGLCQNLVFLALHSSCWFLNWPTLGPWRWKQYVPLKQQQTFTGLHDVKSQKMDTVHSQCCENLKSDDVDCSYSLKQLVSLYWLDGYDSQIIHGYDVYCEVIDFGFKRPKLLERVSDGSAFLH